MKKLLIIGLVLAVTKTMLAQIEPDPLSFFPSSVGNIWQYNTNDGIFETSITNIYEDTSKNKFIIFSNSGPSYKLDTLKQVFKYPFDSTLNLFYYKLDADSGDSWMVKPEDGSERIQARIEEKYNSVVFGKESTVMKITYYGLRQGDTLINEFAWPRYDEILVSGFGEVLFYVHEDGPPVSNRELKGCIIDGVTYGELTDIEEENNIQVDFKLYQNYPNPFNPSTIISYKLQSAGLTELKIYNILGQEITTLEQEFKYPGYYEVNFDASGFTSGIYIYRLTSGNFSETKKLVLIR